MELLTLQLSDYSKFVCFPSMSLVTESLPFNLFSTELSYPQDQSISKPEGPRP